MGGPFLDELVKLAAVSVPMGRAVAVSVESPQKKRKKFPFQGFIDFQGLDIHVENKKGSYREGKGKDGKPWRTFMHHHYGEIEATRGADGDALDAYVGPDAHSPLVVVVHQQKPDTKEYDEDKVMLGFRSIPDALKAYRRQYDRPGFYGGHTAMPIGSLLAWCEDRKRQGKRVKLASDGHGWFECPDCGKSRGCRCPSWAHPGDPRKSLCTKCRLKGEGKQPAAKPQTRLQREEGL